MADLHTCTAECPPGHREHLAHMTDGRWHDDCRFCLRRRVKGGTGLEGEASADQLRTALQGIPHPFALDDVSLLCVCYLDPLHEVHDPVSLLDARAVLNGTGGLREHLARELAARLAREARDG